MADNILYESEARGPQRPGRAISREANTRQAQPPTSGERLHRRRRNADPTYIDPRIVPAGFTYEWKRESVYGQPQGAHMTNLRENHWRPVPAVRHPELAAEGETVIRRPGTILCERPSYLTDEARMEDINDAMMPLKAKEDLMYGSRPNEMTRDHPSVRRASFINQQYSPGEPIPDDGTYAEK